MEIARDSNIAMLSGKVELVQEIDKDKQPGVLMYIPFYRRGMTVETVAQRRAAIKGWVYSPYRMRDLMQGVMSTMSHYGEEPLRLQIYDDTTISGTSLLFDSQQVDSVKIDNPNLKTSMETEFRGKKWTLVFSGNRNEMSFMHKQQIVIWLPGLIITVLLFTLSLIQIRASIKSRQIDQLNKQLERLNADKDRFIAILSHDLKSPFTAILGFLELLTTGLRKFSIEQIETHLNTINDATKNTFNLLQDLLMWTRAHSGKIPFNPEKIYFKDEFEKVISLMMPAAQAKNIKIEYDGPDKIKVLADKDMLKTILRNLVSNAIKFTHESGTIKISAIREDGNTTISVADNGTGIKTDEMNKIFDISKILPSSGTNGEKGSGLGLLLCKEFVETHGGRIWFTSEYGKGSDFRFSLPC
jgi:signal transduction histidine kinase